MEQPEQPPHAPLLREHDGQHTNAPENINIRPPSESSRESKQAKQPQVHVTQHGTRHPSALGRLFRKGWTAETCSCIFALLSLLGLVATLLAHQNKPMPEWPQIVSINSIISLFALLMRAGVGTVLTEGISQSKWQWFRKKRTLHDMERFDSASRGMWGSILLLTGLRMKKLYLIAALGAFVTIMASFTGFALQQLVQFTECLQPHDTPTVSIRKANSYAAHGLRVAVNEYQLFLPMDVAIVSGILSPQKQYTGVYSSGCTTGNCTFASSPEGTFSTLAMVHSCKDVTSEVAIVYRKGTNATRTNIDVRSSGTDPIREHNLTLPLGDDDYMSVQVGPGVLPYSLVTRAANDGKSLFTIKMMIRSDPLKFPDKYQAISCSLHPNVNTYTAEIKENSLRENLVQSIPLGYKKGKVAMHDPAFLTLTTSHALRNGVQEPCDRREQPAPGYVGVGQMDIEASPNVAQSKPINQTDRVLYVPEDCVWTFGFLPHFSIRTYLKDIFDNKNILRFLVTHDGDNYLQTLHRDGNITLDTVNELFKDLAASMTAIIRTNPADNQTQPVRGTVWYEKTCIGVNWAWISYPAVMISLCAVFLVLVHIESRDVESQRLWKSSTLAMLFCELDEEVVDVARPLQRDAMEDTAKTTGVHLERDVDGLRLVGK